MKDSEKLDKLIDSSNNILSDLIKLHMLPGILIAVSITLGCVIVNTYYTPLHLERIEKKLNVILEKMEKNNVKNKRKEFD